MTLKEYKSALWETTREDEEHLQEVERVLKSVETGSTDANDAEAIRQKLRALKYPIQTSD